MAGFREGRRRGSGLWRTLERGLLGVGMSAVAFLIERRLIRAIKQGSVDAAPRTAADADEGLGIEPASDESTPPPKQVEYEAGG